MEGSLTATAYLLATDAARRATIASDVALGKHLFSFDTSEARRKVMGVLQEERLMMNRT